VLAATVPGVTELGATVPDGASSPGQD